MTPLILPCSELKPALLGLSKLSKSSLPILSHLKVERTREGWITLTRTDLDTFITYRLEQPSSGEPCAFLVPVDAFAALLKRSGTKDTLILTQNPDNTLGLQSSQGGEEKIQHVPIQDFPIIPRMKGDPVSVPAPLRQSLLQAMECVSEDPCRPSLNGVYIDVSQSQNHHLVATDGRHMFTSNSFTLPLKHSLIIPQSKFLGWREFNNDGELQMKVTDISDANSSLLVQLSTRKWRLITKAVEGQYPNWRQVLVNPASIQSLLTIDPQRVENLIRTIEKLPCHNNEHYPVGLDLGNGRLSLLAKALEAKTWEKQSIDYVKASGSNVTIFCNRHLLIKALRFGLVDVGIVDSISPMRFSDKSSEMVIMPCRNDLGDRQTPSRRPTNIRRRVPESPPAPRPRQRPQLAHASVPADVFTGIKVLKESFRSGLAVLRSLASSLKEVRRTQKESLRKKKLGACT